jgi:hypothetical protein
MIHPHNLLIQTPMIDKFPLNKPLKTQGFEPSSIDGPCFTPPPQRAVAT